MAVRPILELPDPYLRQRAKKVRKIDSSMLRLAYDLVDTMREAGGVGLAANQVGELWRVITIQLSGEGEEARIYFNPEIVQREGTREVEEGCLSIPGYRGYIDRSVWIKFTALDHTAMVVKFKAEDLLSQALEHEVDHLNGILYIDHLESHEKLVKIEDAPESEESDEQPEPVESDGTGASDDASPDADPRETPASLKIK